MQKNILLSIILITLFTGLYGCSCSERPAEELEITPGLYIVDTAFFEADEGETQVVLTVKLERNSTETVTVDYEIKASTNVDKALAVVGDAADADVRSTPVENRLTFDENTTDELSIPLTLLSDTLYELNEVFIVELTVASGANIVEGIAEITLANDDPKPIASIELTNVGDNLAMTEADPQQIGIKVSLNTISGVDASMKFERSAESFADDTKHGLVAAYRIDYMLYQSGDILPAEADVVIPAGELEAFIEVAVIDDGIPENLESFDIGLIETSHVDTVSTSPLAFSIADNDTITDGTVVSRQLNDTGIVDLPGILIPDGVDSQVDRNIGRDAVSGIVKTGGGRAAFDFTKIDSNGDVMDVSADFASTPWDCVKDNTTGLYWEVKVLGEATERGAGRHYYWHDPNYATNGGDPGKTARYECEINDADAGSPCNTAYYVADINASKKICNMTGWRLPTIEELRSIVDYGVSSEIHYDTEYFAGDKIGTNYIWSSTSVASSPNLAWSIKFGELSEEARLKESSAISGIRLVNDSNAGNN